MPHPKYVAVRQIPPSPGKGEGQMPGVCPGGGGMCEFRIDRYIRKVTKFSATLRDVALTQNSRQNCRITDDVGAP